MKPFPDSQINRSYPKDEVVCIFTEVNEHLRNTEQKQLNISTVYFGLLAVVVSILPTQGNDLLSPDFANACLYALLLVLGCTVNLIQLWYRLWKEHYIDVCRRIVFAWSIEPKLVPCWMTTLSLQYREVKRISPNIDNTAIYLTTSINFLIVLLLFHQLIQLIAIKIFAFFCALIVVLSYVRFTFWIYSMTSRKQKALKA
jgi:hypothetical protein